MSILSNVFSVRFAVVAGSALLLSASAFAASCGTDITAQFTGKVANSPKAPPPFTNKMIALTNNGADLPGTVYLAIYNVPSGIGLQDFTWTSSCDSLPAGTYFIRIYLGYDNIWEAGTTNKLVLSFVNPNNLPVTFNYAVVKGDQLSSPHVVPGDYDGDRRADLGVFEPATATWRIQYSKTNVTSSFVYGMPTIDRFVVGDFDGDLKEDVATFRTDGSWHIKRSSDGVEVTLQFGAGHDIPLPADYDGDGYTDLAVYRPTTNQFHVRKSDGSIVIHNFGFTGAVPVPADYDGDGKADLAYYRADTKSFYIKQSTTGNISTVTYPDLIGRPFAAYFLNIGRDVPATYDPATGKVLFYDPFVKVFYPKMCAPNQRPVFGDFNGDVFSDFATYNAATGEWSLHTDMTTVPGGSPTKFLFGTPNAAIPLQATRSSMSTILQP